MRYKLTIKDRFVVAGETHHNLSGYVVVFTDGVAYVADPAIVEFAKRVHFIDSVEDVSVEGVVEELVREVTPAVNGAVDEDVITMSGTGSFQPPVKEEEEEVSGEVDVSENVVSDVKDTEDAVLTAEEIQGLYEELGTWSAVADHLKITTTTLRKYREDAGLL